MKYLIVSDIHGSLPTLEKVLTFYDAQQCDMLCILGDIINYGPRNGIPEGINPQGIAERLNERAGNIIAIRGNCDSEVDQMLLHFPILSDYTLLVDNGVKLFLTHGHKFNEDHLPSLQCDCFFYGHTHLWKIEKKNNTMVCNTGSITFPKGGNEPTFAVYEGRKISVFNLDGKLLKETCF